MRDCDIKFVNKEITPFDGLSLFLPKFGIRKLCNKSAFVNNVDIH